MSSESIVFSNQNHMIKSKKHSHSKFMNMMIGNSKKTVHPSLQSEMIDAETAFLKQIDQLIKAVDNELSEVKKEISKATGA